MSCSNSKIIGQKQAEALMEEISKMSTEEMIELWNKAGEATRGLKLKVTADELLKDREEFFKHKDLEEI